MLTAGYKYSAPRSTNDRPAHLMLFYIYQRIFCSMKPHIIIKFTEELNAGNIPDWTAVIEQHAVAPTAANHPVDAVFRRFELPCWVTREYPVRPGHPEEREATLHLVYRFILQEDKDIPQQLIIDLNATPGVQYARPGVIGTSAIQRPIAMQLGIKTDRARDSIFLKHAHALTKGHPSIKIAVLDTGIFLDHPELKGTLLPGKDFVNIIDDASEEMADKLNETKERFAGDFKNVDDDPNDDMVGHGTHVAGIISGKGINMPAGVVPACKIIPVRVLAALQQNERFVGAGLVDNINTGIKWAVDQGAQVINMSLGIKSSGGGLPHAEVVAYAKMKGVTIVAASGNDGQHEYYYPGSLPSVICVGATDEEDKVAFFSTYGKQVSFVAPGTNIYSCTINNEYAFSTGTSHASPFVAGAVAMLKSYALQKGRKLSDNQVKYLLKHTADRDTPKFKTIKSGYGKINLIDALKLLQNKLNI